MTERRSGVSLSAWRQATMLAWLVAWTALAGCDGDTAAEDAGAGDASGLDASVLDASVMDGAGADGEAADGGEPMDAGPDAAASDAAPDSGDAGPPPLRILSVAAGFDFNCALRSDGVALCWGNNSQAQLGDGSGGIPRPEPLPVVGGHAFASLAAGDDHVCGVTRSGDLYCWGANFARQVGDPAEGLPHGTPFFVRGDVSTVGAGGRHTCLIDRVGAVGCFGEGDRSQLTGDPVRATATVQAVTLPATASAIALGRWHSCALVMNSLHCWGENADLQLARADTTDGSTGPVTGLEAVNAFGLGYAHSCARHGAGTACWGAGGVGQLGDGETLSRSTPAPVSLADVVQVDGGEQHTCARRDSGEIWCWGWDRYQQIGGGGDRSEPGRILLDGPARDLAVGGQHTCAVLDDGRVFCWGRNIQGQLGTSEAGSESAAPVEVEGLLP